MRDMTDPPRKIRDLVAGLEAERDAVIAAAEHKMATMLLECDRLRGELREVSEQNDRRGVQILELMAELAETKAKHQKALAALRVLLMQSTVVRAENEGLRFELELAQQENRGYRAETGRFRKENEGLRADNLQLRENLGAALRGDAL